MGVCHEGADVGEVAGLESFDSFDGAGDFGDDVAGTAEDAVAHFITLGVNVVHGDIAPALFCDEAEAVFGVLAPFTVSPIGEIV